MSKLPEKWVLLQDNPPELDPSTGNRRPVAPTEVPWTGLLQQRQLASSSVDAGNVEIVDGHVVSSYVLLLDPVTKCHSCDSAWFRMLHSTRMPRVQSSRSLSRRL